MSFSCIAKKRTKRKQLKGRFEQMRIRIGMIATGNHGNFDSLRDAPPPRNPSRFAKTS